MVGRWAFLAGVAVSATVALFHGTGTSARPPTTAPSIVDSQPTVLVTGANRGLGLEWARQFSAAGARVIGTARRPDAAVELKALGVRVEQLDVTDPESVAGLAARLGDQPIDILINNAGIGDRVVSLEQVDPAAVEEIYRVNCVGPMRVTQALLPSLRKGKRKLIVNKTSGLGSIERNTRGGYYGYRESKAALNMFTRSLAWELAPEGFTCIAIAPGWVRTGLGGPMARLSPAESIEAMMGVLNGLLVDDTGKCFNYTGEELPW